MEIINNMFKEFTFFKVKDVDSYAMYVAGVQCFISDGKRYLVVLVPLATPVGPAYLPARAHLYELDWISFQTRTLKEQYAVPEQVLDYKVLDSRYPLLSNNTIDKVKLSLKERTDNKTDYYCPLPIEISLLHDPKKKSKYQYADDLEIRQALNTFQCIIKLM